MSAPNSIKVDDIEYSVYELEVVDDNEENELSQEYSHFIPIEPLEDELQTIIENENYSGLTQIAVTNGPLQEVIPANLSNVPIEICFSENDDQIEEVELFETRTSAKNLTQEEIINKLLEDKISFSEVAELLGEDCDLEAVISNEVPEDVFDEDHAVEFVKELNEQQKYQLKRKCTRKRRRRRRLPPALQGLMGEANLRYARSEYDEAIKMCMEIIRQFSKSHEPYQTLGMIYEEKKMINKALQFFSIAAFLSPNAEEWEKLAELSIHQLGDVRQAVFCWGRAIRANPQNLDYHWTRCNLLEQLGEKTNALKGYIHMVKFLHPDQGKDGLKLAKEIAKIHFENGDINLAQEAMQTAFKKYPSFVTAVDTNLMLEVLMQKEEYCLCIITLVQHMNVELKSEGMSEEEFQALTPEEQVNIATTCVIPPELPVDLQVKFAIAYIHQKKFDIVEFIVESVMKLCKEEYGDLYLEISEAYSKANSPEKAIPLLEALIQSELYSVAAVWLLYAECLVACDRLEDATGAYENVIGLAPQLGEPRVTLSGILQTLGRTEEALSVINQGGNSETLESSLLAQKCKILLSENQLDEFVDMAHFLLKRYFILIRTREEAEVILTNKKMSNKFEALRKIRKSMMDPLEDDNLVPALLDLPIDELWGYFMTVSEILIQKKRHLFHLCHIDSYTEGGGTIEFLQLATVYHTLVQDNLTQAIGQMFSPSVAPGWRKEPRFVELQRLTFSALTSKEFMKDQNRAKEIEFLCLLACVYNESYNFAFTIMRDITCKNLDRPRCWNLLCYIISKADDLRHNRFLLRLTRKHPDSFPLTLLNGHNSLVSGSYKFSVAEYSQAFKQHPNDPMIPLMLGLTYTHMACQKFTANKASIVVTATAFLNTYLEMRKECQESFYNLGRAMHQLNLLPQAVFYYKKALEMPVPTSLSDCSDLNLQKEIAFNLSLIYKKSGNFDLARMYMKKYITYD